MIAGPTAVGKTAIGIQLAKHYKTVIISADSRQFYKELEIGTAKPSPEELQEVHHYFINTKSIEELYGAGHYERDVLNLLDELYRKYDIIIMVGGSGLYIDAVLNGVDDFIEVPQEVRAKINEEVESNGLEWLQKKIQKVDPDYFENSDINNPQRLKRALEVFEHTGKPYSSFLGQNRTVRNFTPVKILIDTKREDLYCRINERVDQMMQKGLFAEVKNLVEKQHLNALKTVGYKELYEHIEGKYDLETAIKLIKQHTRNYAKRQITWFKNKDRFTTFERTDLGKIKEHIDRIIYE